MKRYILDHWRGEHDLRQSILINAFLVNLILGVADGVVQAFLTDDTSDAVYIVYLSVTIGYVSIIAVWQVVGIWRSTNRARKIHGPSFGLIAARVFVVIISLATIYNTTDLVLINFSFIEAEFGLNREVAEFDIELLRETEIALDGGISDKSVSAIKIELQKNDKLRVLHLTSNGGYVDSAQLLIDLVQEYELETYVSWKCLSACTDVFLASDYRSIGLDGYLGYHLADCPGLRFGKEVCAEEEFENAIYYQDRGVADWFVEKMSATPNKDIWEPTFKELSDASVITHIFDGEVDVEAKEYCRKNDCTLLPVLEFREEDGSSP